MEEIHCLTDCVKYIYRSFHYFAYVQHKHLHN